MSAPIVEALLTVSEDSGVTPPTVPLKVAVPPVSTSDSPPAVVPSTVLLKMMTPPVSVPPLVSVTLPP